MEGVEGPVREELQGEEQQQGGAVHAGAYSTCCMHMVLLNSAYFCVSGKIAKPADIRRWLSASHFSLPSHTIPILDSACSTHFVSLRQAVVSHFPDLNVVY